MSTVTRVAMWSGPRNISTALMRSFGSRPDTHVIDEPLYAHYLAVTGRDHPGRDEVLAHHESDWRAVVATLLGPVPGDRTVFYQKHMAHHLLPEIDRSWLSRLSNCFLIREPREMLTSLIRITRRPSHSLRVGALTIAAYPLEPDGPLLAWVDSLTGFHDACYPLLPSLAPSCRSSVVGADRSLGPCRSSMMASRAS